MKCVPPAVVVAIALTSSLAIAQAPDPRCQPVRQPVPSVIDCDAKIDEWMSLRNRYQQELRNIRQINEILQGATGKLLETAILDALNALNPIPTDLQGGVVCLVEQVCKKAVGVALYVGQTTLNQAEITANTLKLTEARKASILNAKALRAAMEAAYNAALQCHADQVARNAEIDRIEAANAAAKAELPSSDPRCSPPKEGAAPAVKEEPRLKYGDLVGKPIELQRQALAEINSQLERCRLLERSGGVRLAVSGCFTSAYNNSFALVDAINHSRKPTHDASQRSALDALRLQAIATRAIARNESNRTR